MSLWSYRLAHLNTLRLDNAKAPTYNFEEIGITRYSIGSIQIDYGTHSLEAAMPFGMYSYGFGYGNDSYDAYGNMGGQSFVDYEPANDTIPPSIEFIADKDRLRIIIRDDREFDTGINDIIFLKIKIYLVLFLNIQKAFRNWN